MRLFSKCAAIIGLIAVGYILGATGLLRPEAARAQIDADSEPSKESSDKIRLAFGSLRDAKDALEQNGRYKLATDGMNVFAIASGGVDAIDDLEKGRGVDPETFAALYAGRAIKEVAEFIGRDEDGRLTYKNKVIRMYPISRLKQIFQDRVKYAGPQGNG